MAFAFLFPVLLALLGGALGGGGDGVPEYTDDIEDDPPEVPQPTLPSIPGEEFLGTTGDDTIVGTDGDDTFISYDGDDVIYGLGGHDLVNSGDGDDTIEGGDLADSIYSGSGSDLIYAGGDNDVIDASRGFDTVYGGTGGDQIVTTDGPLKLGRPDLVFGGEGDDTIAIDDGDTVEGGEGYDLFLIDVGTPAMDPVVIKDFNRIAELQSQANPDELAGVDRLGFNDSLGETLSTESLLAGGLDSTLNSEGHTNILFGGNVVAVLEGINPDDLNTDSGWLANSSEGSVDGPPNFITPLSTTEIKGTAEADDITTGEGSFLVRAAEGADFVDVRDSQFSTLTVDTAIGGSGADTLVGNGGDVLIGRGGQDRFEICFDADCVLRPLTIYGFAAADDDAISEVILLRELDGSPVDDPARLASVEVVMSESLTDAVVFVDDQAVAILRDIDGDLASESTLWIENLDHTPTPTTGDISKYMVDTNTRTMVLETAQGSGKTVSPDLFGTNAIYSINTSNGSVLDTTGDAIDLLDTEGMRFPAGQGDFNGGVDGTDWLNVVTLVDDGAGGLMLRPELTRFLDWASDPNGDGSLGDAQPVTLVIPVKHIPLAQYADFADEIALWSELVVTTYPGLIANFEIGNEYWSIGETEYGQKANMAVLAIKEGMANAAVSAANTPDVIVQMATPNTGSEFHASVDDRGFIDRLRDANQQIIDQLSSEARNEIDGVVEHYYWNKQYDLFEHNASEKRYIDEDFKVWTQNFSKDLDLHLTEWNLRSTTLEQNGMKSAGVLLEQFENIIDLGADSAHIWPAIHNTSNALAGTRAELPISDSEGRVLNSIRGAVFDLMSTSLPGMELVNSGFSNDDGAVEIYTFEDDEKYVIYVASRTTDIEEIDLDLGGLVADFDQAEATRVSYDTSLTGSDGLIYGRDDALEEAEYVVISGERYYLTEYDARANYSEAELTDTRVNLTLLPFEAFELIYFKATTPLPPTEPPGDHLPGHPH